MAEHRSGPVRRFIIRWQPYITTGIGILLILAAMIAAILLTWHGGK